MQATVQHLKVWWATYAPILSAIAYFLVPSLQALAQQHPNWTVLTGVIGMIIAHHVTAPADVGIVKNAVKTMGVFLLCAALIFAHTACSNAQLLGDAQKFATALGNLATAAQADVSAVPAADQAAFTQWTTALKTASTALSGCVSGISGSTGTSAKALACFNSFVAVALNPAALAVFAVKSAATQQKVIQDATYVQLAVNVALAIFGGTAVPAPTVGTTAAPSAESLRPRLYEAAHAAGFSDVQFEIAWAERK